MKIEEKTKQKTILILGGYGESGKLITELLLKETNANVIIAGRTLEKAQKLAQKLNSPHRIQAMALDASDYASMNIAFRRIDMVINAANGLNSLDIVKAAIANKIDYFDIIFSLNKNKILSHYEDQIVENGLCFVTDGGGHPGMPSAFINQASTIFDKDSLEKADIGNFLLYTYIQCNMLAVICRPFVLS